MSSTELLEVVSKLQDDQQSHELKKPFRRLSAGAVDFSELGSRIQKLSLEKTLPPSADKLSEKSNSATNSLAIAGCSTMVRNKKQNAVFDDAVTANLRTFSYEKPEDSDENFSGKPNANIVGTTFHRSSQLPSLKANNLNSCEGVSKKVSLEKPPDNFRDISNYPSSEDIYGNNTNPFLRPNITTGGYADVEHYLDIQFRLLREDYIRPLREGIVALVRGKDKHPNITKKNVWFSSRTRRTRGLIRFDDIRVCFNPGKKKEKNKLDSSKRYMHGSLLCFTKNNFETILFAIVSNRDDINSGQIYVRFCEDYNEDIFEKCYTMIESEVFFEPYNQVLNRLKMLKEHTFPMYDYIVKMSNVSKRPQYLASAALTCSVHYTLCHADNGEEFNINVLDKSTWPSAQHLGLDPSQCDALYTALTTELAVIQGPPGTGKTFMALKIAETILANREETNYSGPILVVCLTNHALDQFLMGTLKFTKNITRVGGQSKCPEMNKYNVKEKRGKLNKIDYMSKRTIMNEIDAINSILKDLRDVKNYLQFKNGIISTQLLGAVLPKCLQNNADFLHWLFGTKVIVLNDIKLPCSFYYMKYCLSSYIDTELKCLKSLEFTNDNCVLDVDNFEEQLQIIKIYTNQLIDNLKFQLKIQQPLTATQAVGLLKQDVWSLDISQRRQLYLYWCQTRFGNDQHDKKIEYYKNILEALMKEVDDIHMENDLETLGGSDVIGLTTTGAARLHELLEKLQCNVVIVEEAAEVMESHVVACVNKHCQHLILIGDHKQLRPSISDYHLGRDYAFDVSLFERLVINRGQCQTLQVQHRMCPEIASLIVPTIYPVLENHTSVLDRPDIEGLAKRVFFVSHNHLEQQDLDNTSRYNEHEAEFLLGLCEHLVMQGYPESQITILTTYNGQMFLIQKKQQMHERIRRVRVTVVDNYQGEENEIILLSLVRSNTLGTIGFVKTENRICVALSRARQALYIVGNIDLLSAKSNTWKSVMDTLVNQQSIGAGLPLRCKLHPESNIVFVATAEDFTRLSPNGGCTEVCKKLLECGHTCSLVCHVEDEDHVNILCDSENDCLRFCVAGLHPCKKKCNVTCGKCKQPVAKDLSCGHLQLVPCNIDPKDFECSVSVKKLFRSCNHEMDTTCSQENCPLPCETILPCGHQCMRTCHVEDDPEHQTYLCKQKCLKLKKNCQEMHQCDKLCHELCTVCSVQVFKKMACGHEREMKCIEDPMLIKSPCEMDCIKTLPCSHRCTKKCYEECIPCMEPVEKVVDECRHKIVIQCSVEPKREHCSMKCEKKLKCDHPCNLLCKDACQINCTVEVTTKMQRCGHNVPIFCMEVNDLFSLKSIAQSRCEEPCLEILQCGHECSGRCNSCHHGRFHIPCEEACTKTLVCGHRCRGKCGAPCPPCKDKCTRQCAHGWRCNQQCGSPCTVCKSKCSWKCEHYECDQLCGLPCNEIHCNEPCKKRLSKCGHACVGLCGEACPPLCWVCDRQQLIIEAMPENAEVPHEPRFVVLPDCGHIVELLSLESCLKWQKTNLRVPSCPRCATPMLKSARYKNQVLTFYNDLANIKHMGFLQENTYSEISVQKIIDMINKLMPKVKKIGDCNLSSACEALDRYEFDGHKKALEKSDNICEALEKYFTDIKAFVKKNSSSFVGLQKLKYVALKLSVFDIICSAVDLLCDVGLDSFEKAHIREQVSLVVDILTEREISIQLAEDMYLEVVRLHHVCQGVLLLKQSKNPNYPILDQTDFIVIALEHKRYTAEVQNLVFKFLEKHCEFKKLDSYLVIKIPLPMQPYERLWHKCSDNQVLEFNGFIPMDNTHCHKCFENLSHLECPIFKKCHPPKVGKIKVSKGHGKQREQPQE